MLNYTSTMLSYENLLSTMRNKPYNLLDRINGNISDSTMILKSEMIALSRCHVFEINGTIGRLFVLTDNKPRTGVRLPYPKVFIECTFEMFGIKIMGIRLEESKVSLSHLERVHDDIPDNFEVDGKENDIFITCSMVLTKDNATGFTFGLYNEMEESFAITQGINGFQPLSTDDFVRVKKSIRSFVMNFIDFLNIEDIELVVHQRKPFDEQKRVDKGKMPLPSSTTVKLTGKLKKYIDNVTLYEHESPSHAFWVRGHYRHLRADRYKERKGDVIWILPFIKGVGELWKQEYEIEKMPMKDKTMWDANKELQRRQRRWLRKSRGSPILS